jgi:hypothetical protein
MRYEVVICQPEKIIIGRPDIRLLNSNKAKKVCVNTLMYLVYIAYINKRNVSPAEEIGYYILSEDSIGLN